jgi:predicted nucleic acid-binding protein
MSADALVDTNILLYASSGLKRYPEKHRLAWKVIADGSYAVSAQVIAEFYVSSQKKKENREPLSQPEAAAWVERLSLVEVADVDKSIVQTGVAYSVRYQIHYWDAALIAAAESIGRTVLYTEDLNHGQKYGSVTVINPFKAN